MRNTGVVIYSQAGSVPPDLYLSKVLENNKSSTGAAAIITVKDENSNIHHREFEMDSFPQTVSLDALRGMLENYKDYDVLLHFGNADQPLAAADMQPFVALEDKDGAIIAVAAIEGEFHPTQRDEANKNRTEDGLLIENYLKPKFAKVMKIAGGDLSEFFKELKTADTESDFRRTWSNNGTIAILGLNGETARIEHNASFRRFDWGWTTRHYNYKAEELKIEEPKQEMVPKQGMFGKVVQAVVDNLPINTGKKTETLHLGQPIPAVGSVATELKKASTDTAVPSDGKVIRPPQSMMGNKTQLRKWYDRAVGHPQRPENYMEGPSIFVTFARIKERDLKYRDIVAETKPITQPVKVEPTKVEPTVLPATTPAPAPEKVGETTIIRKKPLELTPIISAESKMKINARLLAIKSNTAHVIGMGSQEASVMPSKVQGTETKLRIFTEQLGIKREDLLGLSYVDLVGLTRDFPDDMAILILNLLDNAKAVGLKPKEDNVEEVSKTSVPASGSKMFGQPVKAA